MNSKNLIIYGTLINTEEKSPKMGLVYHPSYEDHLCSLPLRSRLVKDAGNKLAKFKEICLGKCSK